MQTRQQRDALLIHGQVKGVQGGATTRYASVVYRFPILVRTNGLQQTLGFFEGKAAGDSGQGERLFLEHLGQALGLVADVNLSSQVMNMDLEQYIWHSRRCLEVAIWYRRFVESILKIDITEAMQDDVASSLDSEEHNDE